ncbi:unnamed protein product [Prunus armeniaca]
MRKHVVQAIIAQTCTSRRFVSSNETTASGLPTRHRVFEHAVRPLRLSRGPCPFVSNSSVNIKVYPSSFLPYAFRIFRRPNSAKLFSQFFNPFELHISALYLFLPTPLHLLKLGPKSSRLSLKTFVEKSNIVTPWIDDDGAATDSCVLGPSVDGGMLERLVAHLKNNLVDLLAFDGGDFQDWNVARPQPQWPTSTPDWEKWLPRIEHFFGQQWKDQGIYHLIKLFDRPVVVDRSLLATALCFWSSATNTMNL